MQNIKQDQQKAWEKRKRFMPMVEFVASIARVAAQDISSSKIPGLQGSGTFIARSNIFEIRQ